MAEIAQYQFLPWTRRGLAAEVANVDNMGSLAGRSNIDVAITLTGAGLSSVNLQLYGPGDIIGIDPRLIVRLSPRANSSDVEPNYFPAIDFDPPDFPWLFTPARADEKDRLRPWLVLIVLDQEVVSPPHTEPGVPLPVIEISSDVASNELPDLGESWAWAHTQVATSGNTDSLAAHLAQNPILNVSRLVSPRRLQQNRRYMACLVPAFDIGVQRGIGQVPARDAPAKLAWDVNNPGTLKLPVYFHWEFGTGPEGDFEALARKLVPTKCPDTVGFARMYMGDAGPELPAIPPDLNVLPEQDPAFTMMDGALRAPNAEPVGLEGISPAIQDALKTALNAPAKVAGEGPDDATPALGPPLYGQWHANRHTVPEGEPNWLRELNLDPRSRVAAGLGAEVIRRNQEDFMQSCWEQVGDVLKANELLSRARLALEASRRLHERHFQPLPADRLVQMTTPVHARTLQGEMTIQAGIHLTSLPDASVDPTMRRLTSPQRPVLKRAALRHGLEIAETHGFRSSLVKTLAEGREDVDPNRFTPDGLLGVKALEALEVPADANTEVNLQSMGLPITVKAGALHTIEARAASVVDVRPQLQVRENLSTVGLVTEAHIRSIQSLPTRDNVPIERPELNNAIEELISISVAQPTAPAFLLTKQPGSELTIDALDVSATGVVTVRAEGGQLPVRVAQISRDVVVAHRNNLGEVLSGIPPGLLDARGGRNVRVSVTDGDIQAVNTGAGPAETVPTNSVPALVKDQAVITRFESAFEALVTDASLTVAPTVATLVPYAIAGPNAAQQTLLGHLDPVRMVPLRVKSMLSFADGGQFIRQSRTFDRIMAAPSLPAPVYSFLAAYDRSRFVPGIDEIPPNAITLLETNPRFIEALMVGVNHEMNRELLWRAYPTDQRGTPLTYFWAWLDGNPDIKPVHEWDPPNALGLNVRGAGAGGQIVLLLRGDLLRRYPNTIIYAWRAIRDGSTDKLVQPPTANDIKVPVFAGRFDPDFNFVGFDLTDDQLLEGDGWFFVLQEQPTEPRFGFDEPVPGRDVANPTTVSEVTWGHLGVNPGQYIRVGGNPIDGILGTTVHATPDASTAAHTALLGLQRPFRIAVHARHIVTIGS